MGKTPLEIASRAYVNAGSTQTGRTTYDAFHPRDQDAADDAMRAALMALAEAGLPATAIQAGAHWQADLKSLPQDMRSAYVEASFRAIIRSIATNNREEE